MTDPHHGAMSYTEIPVDDVGRARKFYGEVFGWVHRDGPEDGYVFFDSGDGGIGGGFKRRASDTPPHPLNYVECEDLDATIARVVAAGGSLVEPKSAFGAIGWLARVTDTEGNLIGLWEARAPV